MNLQDLLRGRDENTSLAEDTFARALGDMTKPHLRRAIWPKGWHVRAKENCTDQLYDSVGTFLRDYRLTILDTVADDWELIE